MKSTVTFNEFHNAFMALRPDNFSYEGLRALYEYIAELEDCIGEELELDVIGLCCDFTEYHGLYSEIINDYPDVRVMEDLEEQTQVIRAANGNIIIQAF